MIPLELTLKNFLSYQQATLDFRGLHTACICGPNGAGKSSLLEAITWVMWGRTRAANEEDVIYTGADEVKVIFIFSFAQQTYKVMRIRKRGGSSQLSFQIEKGNGFVSLSNRSIRAAQELIHSYIKLDYDTFINSAYLRQGRADQFMLLKPNERKTILANLLKLDQYEELAEKAKDIARREKGIIEQLQEDLSNIENQITRKKEIEHQQQEIDKQINITQTHLATIEEQLKTLEAQEYERETLLNQFSNFQYQYRNNQQDSDRLNREYQENSPKLTQLQNLLHQETNITNNYQQLLTLKSQEKILREKFIQQEQLQQRQQELTIQLQNKKHQLQLDINSRQNNLDYLSQQEQEIQPILNNIDSVNAGIQQLKQYRQRLQELDELHRQFIPLQQRHNSLQISIEKQKGITETGLEQLEKQIEQLTQELAKKPQQLNNLQIMDERLELLQKKETRLDWIQQKTQDRTNQIGKLQERLSSLDKELEKLLKKQDSLQNTHANCPLCEQNLDAHHLQQVITKTAAEEEKIESESWLIKEEIVKCQREIQDLNREAELIKQELGEKDSLQQKYWQLENELDLQQKRSEERKGLLSKKETIKKSLEDGTYAESEVLEYRAIEQQLQQLNYDDKQHSLVREEERRWSWVEKKQAEIDKARQTQQQINQSKPNLIKQIEQLQTEITELESKSPLHQQLQEIIKNISEINYNGEEYHQISNALEEIKDYELTYQKLQDAKLEYPKIREYLEEIDSRRKQQETEQKKIEQELEKVQEKLGKVQDNNEAIAEGQKQKQNDNIQLAELLQQKGSIKQTLQVIYEQEKEIIDKKKTLEQRKLKCRVHGELAVAFSKKGIQSLIIETVLPTLEAETNQILARLTSNQLHVQFISQKPQKSSEKITETLEINISDTEGKRPYETYSGGEAFRINFAIRLALSKLLAQRAGTSLQLLVIDEGFGTQDQEGCERLIAAINAISVDFACILTVTHMQQFKEAFQTHIEVRKTREGSQLTLSS